MSTPCPALSLQLLLRDAEGNVVEPAGDLSVPVTLPPAVGPGAQLGLSQGVLGAVLALAQRQGAFSMDISSSAVGRGRDQGCSHHPLSGLTPITAPTGAQQHPADHLSPALSLPPGQPPS